MSTHFLQDAGLWVAAVSGGIGAVKSYIRRRVRRRAESTFVHDMATNHLPHIYNTLTQQSFALVKIGSAVGADVQIDHDNPPPIRFVTEKDVQESE